jgi:cyclase
MYYVRGFFFLLAMMSGLSVLAPLATGQGRAPAPFMVHQVTPNIYWVEGGGGNSGVIVTEKSVVVIDAKTTPAQGKQLADIIAKITPKPVTTVILSHSDADHVNGLVSLPAGIKIIAHENDKKEQEAALAAAVNGKPVPDATGFAEPLPPVGHLPNQLVSKKKEQLKIDGTKLELLHWAPAHTSGDLVVYLPDQKIVFTGDIVAMNFPDPLIHLDKNGSSEGWITTMKGMIALNCDQYIAGHGDVQTKASLQKMLNDAETKRAKIKELVAQGKSLDEIKAAIGGTWNSHWPSYIEVVYKELTNKGA